MAFFYFSFFGPLILKRSVWSLVKLHDKFAKDFFVGVPLLLASIKITQQTSSMGIFSAVFIVLVS